MSIIANISLSALTTGAISRKVYDRIDNFWNARAGSLPDGLKSGFHTGSAWIDMITEEVLIRSATIGSIASLLIVSVIILIMTKNWILSGLVELTVIFNFLSVLGIMVIAGWSLGIIEAVSLVIVIGLSVDFSLHFAEAYLEAKRFNDRYKICASAILYLGISIVSATATTLMSTLLLFASIVIFFVRFGVFIFFTIGISLFYLAFFLIPLLMMFGPLGDNGTISKEKFKNWYNGLREKKSKKKIKNANNEDPNDSAPKDNKSANNSNKSESENIEGDDKDSQNANLNIEKTE